MGLVEVRFLHQKFFKTPKTKYTRWSNNYKVKKQNVCLKLKKMFAKSSSVCQYALLNLKLNNKFPVDTWRSFNVDTTSHDIIRRRIETETMLCIYLVALYIQSQSLSNIAQILGDWYWKSILPIFVLLNIIIPN